MPTKLTDRQAAVLAAVERLGRPIMADLWEQFPDLAPSAIRRVLVSLERKGLIAHAGDEAQAYINGVRWWSTAMEPGDPDPRLESIAREIESADLRVEHSIDAHAGHVDLFLPLVELESYLLGLPSEPIERLRAATAELQEGGDPYRVEIGTTISPNPEPRLVIRIRPERLA